MAGDGIKHGSRDITFSQKYLQCVAPGMGNDKLVIDRNTVFYRYRPATGGTAQGFLIKSGELPSPRIPFIQVRKLDSQNGCLDLVETTVATDFGMLIAVLATVISEGCADVPPRPDHCR